MAFRGLTTLKNVLNKSTVQINAFNKPQVRNYILSTRALRNVKAEQDGKPTPEFQTLLRRTGQNLRKIGGEPAPYKKKYRFNASSQRKIVANKRDRSKSKAKVSAIIDFIEYKKQFDFR